MSRRQRLETEGRESGEGKYKKLFDQLPNPDDIWASLAESQELSTGHEILQRMVGKWHLEVNLDFAGYGPCMEAEGISIIRPAFGGRFLVEHASTIFPGGNYQAQIILGYDKDKEEFSYVCHDNFVVTPMILSGKWDESDFSINWEGRFKNPMFKLEHHLDGSYQFLNDRLFTFEYRVPNKEGVMATCLSARYTFIQPVSD